jgi:hypothetical protein
VASKWEKQLLGGLGLIGLSFVILLFANQLPKEYVNVWIISIPIFIVGMAFAYYGIKTKRYSFLK